MQNKKIRKASGKAAVKSLDNNYPADNRTIKSREIPKSRRQIRQVCRLARVHQGLESWRKWLPQIMDHLLVTMIQIVLALLAAWDFIHFLKQFSL